MGAADVGRLYKRKAMELAVCQVLTGVVVLSFISDGAP